MVLFSDADGDLGFGTGDTVTGSFHHNVNAINEIESAYTDGTASSLTYDDGGSITDDGEYTYVYDPWNRIVSITDAASGSPIAAYRYDALGRRIHKTVSNSGDLNTSANGDFYYYEGNRLIEHEKVDGSGVAEAHRRYVWGIAYIDELIGFYDDDAVGGGGSPALHFVLTDANYNVATITDDAGEPVQQFAWMPYGAMLAAESITGGLGGTVTTIDFTADPELLLIPFGHQGLSTDLETGLIYNRARHLSTELGRFVQRDPNETVLLLSVARMAAKPFTFGETVPGGVNIYGDGNNLYTAWMSNPFAHADPDGLFVHRMMQEIVGSAIASYAFGIDAIVYSMLDGTHRDVDESLRAFPLFVPSAMAGGLIAGATMTSSTGNILGGGIAGGLVSYGLDQGFMAGFYSGSAGAAAVDAAIKVVSAVANSVTAWLDSATVAAGAGKGGLTAGAFGGVMKGWGLVSPKPIRYGMFSIRDWSGYPTGVSRVPKPKGPFRLLEGAEYQAARRAADNANKKLRKAWQVHPNDQIHEIHPIKFGGDPVDPANKIALPLKEHNPFNVWWKRLQVSIEKKKP